MNHMKRVGLAVLVLVLAAIVGTSPAFGGGKLRPISYTYDLTLPETEPPEPRASGRLTLTIDPPLPGAGVQVNVSCRNLTPGKEYSVLVQGVNYEPGFGEGDWGTWFVFEDGRTFTADKNGRLNGEFLVGLGCSSTTIYDLWIWNDAGNLVLEWHR